MVDTTAESIWGDFVTDGVPSSGAKEPRKRDIRAWGAYLESLGTLAFTSSLVYSTRAALYANLVPGANVPALVIGDPTPGYDGLYMKVGATTTGSWTQLTTYVPGGQFVKATDAGAGTANAITATSALALSSSSGAQLIRCNVYEANTSSPVTITFNGNVGPLTIKTNSGLDISAGGLTSGMTLLGTVEGSTFRLLSEQASAAVLAAAEAAAALAQAAAVTAVAAAASLDPAELKTKLSANQTYYIRSTAAGNAGTGLTNLDADAFLSLTSLWTYLVKNVNANGYTITIKGTGTFTGAYTLNSWIEGTTPATVILEAESGVNTDLVFDPTSGIAITAQYGAVLTYQNFSAESTSIVFQTIFGAKTHFETGMRLGASGANLAKIYTTRFGYSQVNLDHEVYGGGGAWMQSDHTGNIRCNFGTNPTVFTGSPTFIKLFALDIGEITITGTPPTPVWSGSCGGGLAVVNSNGFFQWAKGSALVWPTGIATMIATGSGNNSDGLQNAGSQVYDYQTGTLPGPSLSIQRKGNADAAALGQVLFYGDDSAGNAQIYAKESVTITDWTNGAETALWTLQVPVAGTLTSALRVSSAGNLLGNPTGGNKGFGTLNAIGVYDDNTLLTDLVLDMVVTGSFDVEQYAAHPIAGEIAQWWFDLDAYAASWRDKRSLPGMKSWADEDDKPSNGELITRLTAVVETMAAHIEKLNERTKDHDRRLTALAA